MTADDDRLPLDAAHRAGECVRVSGASAARETTPAVGTRADARSRAIASLRAALVESELGPFLAAVAFAIGVSLLVMPPPAYGDAYHVFNSAQMWPTFPPDMFDIHHVMRIGLLLPVRAFRELLGDGQLAFVVAATVMNALMFVGTYAVGSALFGRVVGVASVALLAIHPFFVIVNPFAPATSSSTGSLLPDMPAAGIFALGIAALAVAARADERRQRRYLVLAGVGFGVAYLVREYLALMFFAIPFFMLILGLSLRRLITVGATMATVFCVELVHSTLVFGHPLARLRTAAEHGADNIPDPPTTTEVLGRFLQVTIDPHPLGAIFLVSLVAMAVGWLVTRDRRLLLTIAWFLALWVPLTLAAGILNPDSPSLRSWIVRYWTPVFPALIVGGLGALTLLVGRVRSPDARRAIAGSVIVVLAAVYVVPALGELARVPRDTAWNEFRGWLASRPDLTRFWTDGRTAQTLTFYTRTPAGEPVWSGTVSSFRQRIEQLPEEAARGPLLYTPRYGPEEKPSEANGWRLVWQSSDRTTLSLWER